MWLNDFSFSDKLQEKMVEKVSPANATFVVNTE